jgi:carboxyl-terminal processing protease
MGILLSCSEDSNPTNAGGNRNASEEYLFSAQFLYAYFLFQDRLPENPFAFTSPAPLYESVDEPFTDYIPPGEAQLFLDALSTQDAGLGVLIDSVAQGFVITEVIPNSPADDAGLVAGDTVVAVDGTPVAGISYPELSLILRGEVGETRTIEVRRGLELPVVVTVVIDTFLVPSVFVDSLDSSTAYIRITSFFSRTSDEGGTSAEFSRALEQTIWAEYTVLDLRDNPGGELGQAFDVIDEFLGEGENIIRTSQREFDPESGEFITRDTTFEATAGGDALNRSFVVLINELSASASELLIAALADNRPEIPTIGQTTYGKARGQRIAVTPDTGVARVTYARFSPVGAEEYDLVGIKPRIPISNDVNPIQFAVDEIEGGGVAKALAVNPSALNRIAWICETYSCREKSPLLEEWDEEAFQGFPLSIDGN